MGKLVGKLTSFIRSTTGGPFIVSEEYVLCLLTYKYTAKLERVGYLTSFANELMVSPFWTVSTHYSVLVQTSIGTVGKQFSNADT